MFEYMDLLGNKVFLIQEDKGEQKLWIMDVEPNEEGLHKTRFSLNGNDFVDGYLANVLWGSKQDFKHSITKLQYAMKKWIKEE